MRLRRTVCVGTFPNLGTPTLNSLNSLLYRSFFFVQVPCVRATVDNSDNAGPMGCAGRWRALQLHVPAALTRAARARHADADLGNLSTPHLRTARCTSAARSSHRCVCQCRCHASYYTELAHRHSRRAIADGSREPEYAPPTTSPLHLPRVPHTVLRLPRHRCHLATHYTKLMRENCRVRARRA